MESVAKLELVVGFSCRSSESSPRGQRSPPPRQLRAPKPSLRGLLLARKSHLLGSANYAAECRCPLYCMAMAQVPFNGRWLGCESTARCSSSVAQRLCDKDAASKAGFYDTCRCCIQVRSAGGMLGGESNWRTHDLIPCSCRSAGRQQLSRCRGFCTNALSLGSHMARRKWLLAATAC